VAISKNLEGILNVTENKFYAILVQLLQRGFSVL
jgi:hypothetical protein